MDSYSSFEIAQNFTTVSAFSPLLPFVVLIAQFHFIRSPRLRFIGYLIIHYAVFTTIFWVTGRMGIVMTPLSHIYTVLEFLILTAFFHETCYNVAFKKLLRIQMVVIPLFGLANAIYIQGWFTPNSIASGASNIIIIFNCLYFFYEILKNPRIENLTGSAIFWAYITILFYFSGNLFLYVMRDSVSVNTESPLFLTYWVTNSMVIIIKDILFVVAIFLTKKNSAEPTI